MGEAISEKCHQSIVRVAAQDAQPAERPPGARLVAGEDAVTGQKEIAPKPRRQESRTQCFGLNHCDGEEPETPVGVQYQSWRQERLQQLFRKRVRQHQRLPEVRPDRDRMPLQPHPRMDEAAQPTRPPRRKHSTQVFCNTAHTLNRSGEDAARFAPRRIHQWAVLRAPTSTTRRRIESRRARTISTSKDNPLRLTLYAF